MSVLPTYMYVHYVPSASGGKKRKSDPLKLELGLWTAIWVLGIKPQSFRCFGRVASALYC